jgi:hypothetical protein
LSGAYLALGRFAEAERAADQAIAIDPEMTAASANRDAARRLAEETSRLR